MLLTSTVNTGFVQSSRVHVGKITIKHQMPNEQNVDFYTDDAPVEGFSPATGLAKQVPAPGMVVLQYGMNASTAEMSRIPCKSEILVTTCGNSMQNQ